MMKVAALAAALIGSVAASQNTHAYIIRSANVASNPPTLSLPVAHAILHQRLTPDRSAVSLEALGASDASSLAHIATFGRSEPKLFERAVDQPGQDVIVVEGLSDGEAAVLGAGFGGAAFVIEGTVGADENAWLMGELRGVGVENAVAIDVKKNPHELDNLITHMDELRRRAASGIAETIVLAFPDATAAKQTLKWSAVPALRRRQESVMAEADADPNAVPSSHMTIIDPDALDFDSDSDFGFDSAFDTFASDDDFDSDSSSDRDRDEDTTPSSPPLAFSVPACFSSADACVAGTNNCSAHGECRNRWGPEAGNSACFACHCLRSADGTQWGGDVCTKVDISSPFWLLVGTSFVLVWVVGGAVAMLYSVGEQKLPGVIGAGVHKK